MAYVKKEKQVRDCQKCGSPIPHNRRSDALYCSQRCRAAAEKARYCEKNPEYVKRQRKLVREIKHKQTYGHTNFLENPLANTKDKYRHARAMGYRSGLEVTVANQLEKMGVDFGYESMKIEWVDHKVRKYTPDLVLPNGIIIETKGRFVATDRRKHLEIQKQHPELDIRFVFSNANNKLNKGSKTTYAKWCEQKGFKWAEKVIPEEWLDE